MVHVGILCKPETLQGETQLFYDGTGGLRNGIQCDKVPTLPIGPEVLIPHQPINLGISGVKSITYWKDSRLMDFAVAGV